MACQLFHVICYEQYLPGINKGVIYVGTHGRGIFKSSNTSSISYNSSDDLNNFNSVSIFPNPAETFINIDINLTEGDFINDVSIIDLMGKEVYKSRSLASSKIDISFLEDGNYIIIINSNLGKQVGKFIKTN